MVRHTLYIEHTLGEGGTSRYYGIFFHGIHLRKKQL